MFSKGPGRRCLREHQGEKIAKKALDNNSEILDYHLTYASILSSNGKKSEALKVANNSINIAEAQGGLRKVQQLIKRIEG